MALPTSDMQQVLHRPHSPLVGMGGVCQHKNSQVMIVGMYTATLGSEQALRMPSIGQIGKWLRDVKSDFSLHPRLNFAYFSMLCFSPRSGSPELSLPFVERPTLFTQQCGSNGGAEPESPCSSPNPLTLLKTQQPPEPRETTATKVPHTPVTGRLFLP